MPPQPLFETTRGGITESVHYGDIAVVDSNGKLLASLGDPHHIAFLRSSAKPFQALPFVERGGVEHFHLTLRELAIACASHEGSALHLQTVREMQIKIGIDESYLQCGAHLPGDAEAFKALILQDKSPTPLYNNCSGKHTAMLAHAKMRGLPLETYLDIAHPIQQDILASLSDLCRIPSENIHLGIDGCSAPNFAMPLYNAALGMARLCDPHDLPAQRAEACRKITSAMTSHPEMVSADGEFDCELMRAGEGRIVCKRGAEGYQIIGLMPGALGKDAPGVGIAFKVSDGDAARMNLHYEWSARVRPAVTLEILRQLGALSSKQEQALGRFGPVKSLHNYRGIQTGLAQPVFSL
ncbi:MAG: asparaginase [Chloroflexota bacterium]|nr:asparaginase [Chloroflexota bacterium]MBI5704906.1 asparaginase [Chloroflexota bacterium]